MPPGGLPQTSYLCEELRKNFPQLGIIVGYWGCDSNLDEVIAGLRAAGATYVTTTLQGARSHILSMCESSDSLRSHPMPHPPQVRLSILNRLKSQEQESGCPRFYW